MEPEPSNGDAEDGQKRFKFSLGKGKSSQRRKDALADGKGEKGKEGTGDRELIVALEGSDVLKADGSVSTKGAPKVIPKLENTWKPVEKAQGGKSAALSEILHEVEDTDRFEAAAEAEDKDGGLQYGLSVRDKPPPNSSKKGPSIPLRDLEAQKLREDLGTLPDEVGLEAYESMPIENFGEALLRGMGWSEGKGIGRNGKGVAEAVEYVPRPSRLGLGAKPKQKQENEKKYIKPGESRDKPKDLVAPTGPDGKVRHVRKVSEKLVERDSGEVKEGKIVRIVRGRHRDLEAKVKSALGVNSRDGVRKWLVRLVKSEEDVEVWEDEVVDRRVWEEQQAEAEARRKALASLEREKRESGGERPSKRARGSEGDERQADKGRSVKSEQRHRDEEGQKYPTDHVGSVQQHRKDSSRRGDTGKQPMEQDRGLREKDDDRGYYKAPVSGDDRGKASKAVAASLSELKPWIMPHIRVRIISKERAGGRLYLSKGVIADVVTPVRCDLLMDGKLVENVRADELETALPKRGGRVAVLRGPHRGERGKLLERSSETEEAVVQLAQTFEILRFPLDDVAEFVGDEGAYEG